jgi:hypothetical protein
VTKHHDDHTFDLEKWLWEGVETALHAEVTRAVDEIDHGEEG